jgi:hypothetical protein
MIVDGCEICYFACDLWPLLKPYPTRSWISSPWSYVLSVDTINGTGTIIVVAGAVGTVVLS